jgi:hypothetical protein
MDAQLQCPQGSSIDTRAGTRIEEDTQPAGGMWASGEHASNEICGTGFLLCDPRSTHSLTCIFAIGTGTVREPRSRWTKVGYQLDLFCSRPDDGPSRRN